MRSTWETLLSVLLSFSLIGPALLAGVISQTPECCKRLGKHHCSMGSGDAQQESSGSAINKTPARCPYYSVGRAVPAHGKVPLPRAAQMTFALVISHPAGHAQTEARYRISFSRSAQKRGPPRFSI
jgi:hypothetical protein